MTANRSGSVERFRLPFVRTFLISGHAELGVTKSANAAMAFATVAVAVSGGVWAQSGIVSHDAVGKAAASSATRPIGIG
jgi:hypothetical protein